MNAVVSPPAAVAAPAEAPPAAAVPADRITELYRGEIFTEETARAARDRIHWMCAQCEGEQVLDVGCSQGIASILLAREGFVVTAIDTHPESIAFAQREIEAEEPLVRQRLKLIQTDLISLPDEPAFDTILLGEVIEHQVRPDRLLRAAKVRLNPGGRLVVTTPFALHPHADHKVSLFPRDLVELAECIGLAVTELFVDGNYMRCAMVAPEIAGEQPGAAMLLKLTEAATLDSQQQLFSRLDERSQQLKKKTDAANITQRKLAEATAARESDARQSALALDKLRTRLESEQASRLQSEKQAEQDRVASEERLRTLQTKLETTLREAHTIRSKLDEAENERAEDQGRLRTLQSQMEATLTEARTARSRMQELEIARIENLNHLRGLQSQLEAASAEAETSRSKLHDFEIARTADQGRLRTLQSEVTRREQLLRTVQSRLSESQARAQAAELAFKHERQNFRNRLADAKTTLQGIKAGTSFRLGRTIVRGVKTPSGVVRLPGELWSLWRDVQERRRTRDALVSGLRAVAQVAAAPTSQQNAITSAPARRDRAGASRTGTDGSSSTAAASFSIGRSETFSASALSTRALAEGIGPVKALLLNARGHADPRKLAFLMLQVGKALADADRGEEAFDLAEAALSVDRSEQTLRGYFWAAQRSRRFEDACRTIRELEQLYGAKPNTHRKAVLEKLHVSPAYQLSLLNLVVNRPHEQIEVTPGRVCYVLHNSLPYSSGGYGTRSHGVASGLKAAGREVVILTRPGFPLDIKTDLAEADIPEEDLLDGIRYVRTLQPHRKGLSMLQYVKAAADALEQQLRRMRPEIVVAASNHVTALPALIAARRLGLPFIYEIRGLWEITRISREQEFEDTPAFAVQRLLESKVAQLADHVFTLTEPMREELISRGVPVEKIDLLPNSCDPERFLPRPRDQALAERLGIPLGVPVIGYVGTFVDYEGLEDLTLACAILKQREVDFRLMLVGNENASGTDRGPITEQILRIADEEGLTDRLIMPGRVPHEEVESYYSLIDIAPFPRKPWPVCEMVSPMKPLEAMAMEKAVLVSSVRALTEMIVDGQTGRVFDKGSVSSLADRLQELIDAPQQRIELGRRGRAWVGIERTWKQIGVTATQRIDKVLHAHRQRHMPRAA